MPKDVRKLVELKRPDWLKHLMAQGVCDEVLAWASQFSTFEAAWNACDRGDWMLWWLGRTQSSTPDSGARKRLAKLACQCARLSLPGKSPALDAVEKWAHGDNSVSFAHARQAARAETTPMRSNRPTGAACSVAVFPVVLASSLNSVSVAHAAEASASEHAAASADLVRAAYPTPFEVI